MRTQEFVTLARAVDYRQTHRRSDGRVVGDVDVLRVRSIKQVAAAANVSLGTMRRLIRAGLGPTTIRLSERRLGVRERDFVAWLESRRPV